MESAWNFPLVTKPINHASIRLALGPGSQLTLAICAAIFNNGEGGWKFIERVMLPGWKETYMGLMIEASYVSLFDFSGLTKFS